MLRSFLLYLSEKEFPKTILTAHGFGRRMAARFIAGEHLEAAVQAVRRLNAEGLEATLDYLGEAVSKPAAAEEALRVYLGMLDRLAAENLRSHVSVKLTQLGLAFDEDLALWQLKTLSERAAKHGNFVRIDMESSGFTESTLRVFRRAKVSRDTVGVVIQSYLYRSEKDVGELLKEGARIRLVKGAYQEPPSLAFPRKADVDANFEKLMRLLLRSGHVHAIATHDVRLIKATKQFARSQGLGPERFEFQMLFGIRRRLQRELAREGYRVRIYVPFGRQWYPYFMRRLAERPANVLFLARNLFRD
jgi:proline dehydrogenase